MKYQLVLQWTASSINDYDDMIWVEEALKKGIGQIGSLEGHDVGEGQVNIFLETNDPYRAFDEIKRVLGSRDFMIGLKAAFREQSESDYRIIYPIGLASFFVT